MATPARFDCWVLVSIAVVHVAVQATHAYSHLIAEVPNTALLLGVLVAAV